LTGYEDFLISHYINRITIGKYIFEYNNQKLCQYSPSADLMLEGDLYYQNLYEENLYSDNFVAENVLEFMLYENQVIPFSYKTDYEKLEKQIENVKIDIYKNFYNKKTVTKFKHQLKLYTKQLDSLYQKRHSWDFLLLTNHCNKARTEFLLINTLYYYDSNKRVFTGLDNNILLDRILFVLSEDPLKNIDIVRQIAKHNLWRSNWNINKSTLCKTTPLTDSLRGLISLSKMYDNIYEHPDCPSDDIIEDDDALDGWSLWQNRKRSQEKKQKGVEDKLGNTKNSSEIFLITEDKESAQEVIGMNSQESLQSYKERIEKVNLKQGPVQETEFIDVQNRIRQEMLQMRKKHE